MKIDFVEQCVEYKSLLESADGAWQAIKDRHCDYSFPTVVLPESLYEDLMDDLAGMDRSCDHFIKAYNVKPV